MDGIFTLDLLIKFVVLVGVIFLLNYSGYMAFGKWWLFDMNMLFGRKRYEED